MKRSKGIRYKVATHMQIALEFTEDIKQAVEIFKPDMKQHIKDATLIGFVPVAVTSYNEGYVSDDFIKNRYTILGQRFTMLAPRIVSRRHYKKYNYRKFGNKKYR